MKVFISWSGQRSEALATALRDWLPLMLHYVVPWVSNADIQAGERWSIEIAKELEESNFGIICVTKENVNAPWILFEAGALAKSLQDGRVIPLLLDLDVKDISGPLAQFQAKKVGRADVKQVIQSLNAVAAMPISESKLEALLDALWPKLEKQIGAILPSTAPDKHLRPEGEILEEVVAALRRLEQKVHQADSADASLQGRPRAKLPTVLIGHVARATGENEKGLLLLIAASVFRDTDPWIYELAVDAYRAGCSGNERDWEDKYYRFRKAISLAFDTPMGVLSEADRSLVLQIRAIVDMVKPIPTATAAPNAER